MDLAIRNASIVDGGGSKRCQGDIGVAEGVIVAVGEVPAREKLRESPKRAENTIMRDLFSDWGAQTLRTVTVIPVWLAAMLCAYLGQTKFARLRAAYGEEGL